MIRFLFLAAVGIAWPFAVPARAQHLEEENRDAVQTPAADKTESADLGRVAELIEAKTNAFRQNEHRKPVSKNKKLEATVRYFADYMARTDEYGHTADGNRPSQRAKQHGYDYCIIAENIAYAYNSRGFTTEKLADEFFNGWKHSPEHRKNMLDADVTETAVAVARSEKTGHYYAVQMFGRPKSLAIEFKIENKSDEAVSYTIGDHTFDLPPRVIRTHTRCRPPEVQFHWPDKEQPQATIKPKAGDRFIVTRNKNQFAVKKQ